YAKNSGRSKGDRHGHRSRRTRAKETQARHRAGRRPFRNVRTRARRAHRDAGNGDCAYEGSASRARGDQERRRRVLQTLSSRAPLLTIAPFSWRVVTLSETFV